MKENQVGGRSGKSGGTAASQPRAAAWTSTAFRLIKLLLSAAFNSVFSIPDHSFRLFSTSICPSIPPLLFPPPSLSLPALSFAESYWSRRRLISPSLRACVMKHMRTELITAIFCRKLISRNKDPKSFSFQSSDLTFTSSSLALTQDSSPALHPNYFYIAFNN